MCRLAEEHGARNVTIAQTDTNRLLREKYVSRDKFLSGMQ